MLFKGPEIDFFDKHKRFVGRKNESDSMHSLMEWNSSRKRQEQANQCNCGAESTRWQSESQAQFVSYAPTETSHVDEGDKENCNEQTIDAKQDIEADNTSIAQEDNPIELCQDLDTEDNEAPTKPNSRQAKKKSKRNSKKKGKGSRVSQPKLSARRDLSSDSKGNESDVEAKDASQLVKPLPSKLTNKDISIEMLEHNHIRRRNAQKMIRSRWDAKRKSTAARDNRMTRELPNSALSFLYGKPPFSTFGESNRRTGGAIDQRLMLSYNITPELYPNEPEHQQTFDSAMEKAVVERGPLQIGCKERLVNLNESATKGRLAARRRIHEVGRPAPTKSVVSIAAAGDTAAAIPVYDSKPYSNSAPHQSNSADGFFVDLSSCSVSA